jgi:hypothetical protein
MTTSLTGIGPGVIDRALPIAMANPPGPVHLACRPASRSGPRSSATACAAPTRRAVWRGWQSSFGASAWVLDLAASHLDMTAAIALHSSAPRHAT